MPLDKSNICYECASENEAEAVYRIHPAIGVARVGNSPREFFMAPESPGREAKPFPDVVEAAGDLSVLTNKKSGRPYLAKPPAANPKSFRDFEQRIKRQAVRFRIYRYTKRVQSSGKAEWVCTGEITAAQAEITWGVHLKNKKNDAKAEAVAHVKPRTNDLSLVFDSQKKEISTSTPTAHLVLNDAKGFTHKGEILKLGELLLDRAGRLVVLGGHGNALLPVPTSGVPFETDFFVNPGAYDDVADGPITATIKLRASGVQVPVASIKPAWVVVAPPRFAPYLYSITSLYDRMLETALFRWFDGPTTEEDPRAIVEKGHGIDRVRKILLGAQNPSFNEDINPIFKRTRTLESVFGPALGRHPKLDKLKADPTQDDSDLLKKEYDEARSEIQSEIARYLAQTETRKSGEKLNDAHEELQSLLKKRKISEKTRKFLGQFARFRNYVYQVVKPPVPWKKGGNALDGGGERVRPIETSSDATTTPQPRPLSPRQGPKADTPTELTKRLDDFQHTMPAIQVDNAAPLATVTFIQHSMLRKWAIGLFEDPGQDYTQGDQDPFRLDRAALENCCGGAFYPGIEVGLLCIDPTIFDEPFRLAHGTSSKKGGLVEAGFFTQQMAVPWQADFLDCNSDGDNANSVFWPAQRPINVYTSKRGDSAVESSSEAHQQDEFARAEREKDAEIFAKLPVEIAGSPTVMSEWDRGVYPSDKGDTRHVLMVERWSMLGFLFTEGELSFEYDRTLPATPP